MNQAYFRRQRLVLLAALLAAIACDRARRGSGRRRRSRNPTQPHQPQPSRTGHARPMSPPASRTDALTSAIETAEKTIQHLAELEEELGGLRVDVETILAEFDETAETLRPQLAAVRSQIEKLGPPPGKDGPPEAPALAAERARLTALASELDSAIKSTELTWVRARQLIEKITVLRHSLFTKNLMERRPSPLLPGVWRDFAQQDRPAVGHRLELSGGRLAALGQHQAAADLGCCSAAALVLFVVLKYAIARLTDRRQVRTRGAAAVVLRAGQVGGVGGAAARAAGHRRRRAPLRADWMPWTCCFPPTGRRAAAAVLKAIVLYAAVSALIFAVLAPRAPQWRLVSLADGPTRRVGWLLCAITAVYAIDAALTEILPRVLRAAGAQRRAVVRGEHGLRRPAHRPAADAVHAASRKCTRRNRSRRVGCGRRRPTHLSARPALAQAAAVADRARHPGAGAARLRGARALPGPAAGDDRHRRRRRAGCSISPSAR